MQYSTPNAMTDHTHSEDGAKAKRPCHEGRAQRSAKTLHQAQESILAHERALDTVRRLLQQVKDQCLFNEQSLRPGRLLDLPEDILSQIMEFVCCPRRIKGEYDYYDNHGCKVTLSLSGFRMVGVCQKFRRVALGSPRIWSCVDSRGGRWRIRVMLERSKNAPLTLAFSLTRKSTWLHCANLLDFIEHRKRCVELRIDKSQGQGHGWPKAGPLDIWGC